MWSTIPVYRTLVRIACNEPLVKGFPPRMLPSSVVHRLVAKPRHGLSCRSGRSRGLRCSALSGSRAASPPLTSRERERRRLNSPLGRLPGIRWRPGLGSRPSGPGSVSTCQIPAKTLPESPGNRGQEQDTANTLSILKRRESWRDRTRTCDLQRVKQGKPSASTPGGKQPHESERDGYIFGYSRPKQRADHFSSALFSYFRIYGAGGGT